MMASGDTRALLVYLGGAPDSEGVEPVGADARLAAHFASSHAATKKACEAIIDELMQDDQSWRLSDLDQIGKAAASRMKRLHPGLSDILLAKLGNWYALQWR